MPQDYKQLIYNIIGAAMEVHRELGWGLQEPIYTESLHLELLNRSIENDTEKHLPCYYKNRLLEKYYQMDIVVGDIVVELKSVSSLLPVHRAQLFNYMRLTKAPLGLLINFGNYSLQSERYAYIERENECVLLDKDLTPIRKEDI